MNQLRTWLLKLAQETMTREGSEDAAHDYDHLVRVMALAETISAREGGDLPCITGRRNQKIYSPLPTDIIEPVNPLIVRSLRDRPDYSPSLEFQLLFGNMPERMTTRTGRMLAQERYDYMKEFFVRLRKEVEGEL